MLPEGAKYGMGICRPYPGDPLTKALKVAGTKVGSHRLSHPEALTLERRGRAPSRRHLRDDPTGLPQLPQVHPGARAGDWRGRTQLAGRNPHAIPWAHGRAALPRLKRQKTNTVSALLCK